MRGKLPGVLSRCEDAGILSASFSPDGGRLATAGWGQTALVWDLTRPPARLCAGEAEAEWEALASADAGRAYDSVLRLAGDPERTVSFLRTHLQPASAPDRERVAKLIAELDSDKFAARDGAEKELLRYADSVAPALRRARQAKPSPEKARRLQRLFDEMEGWPVEELRSWRALEVLERMGTAEARQVLQVVADGLPGVRLTQAAKESLGRLSKLADRPSAEPNRAP